MLTEEEKQNLELARRHIELVANPDQSTREGGSDYVQ
jgi:hypothetical protein